MKDKTKLALVYLTIIAFVMIFPVAGMIFVMGYSISDFYQFLPLYFLVCGGIVAFAVWISIHSMKRSYGKDWIKVGTREWIEENVPEHVREEFERRRRSLRIRLLRAIGLGLLISTVVTMFVTKNPLWATILFVLTGTVLVPVGNVATMMFPGATRRFYWMAVAFVLTFWIGLLYVAIRYWPEFLGALGF